MNKPEQVSFHGVTMESMDPRVEPEDDRNLFVIPGLTGNPGIHA